METLPSEKLDLPLVTTETLNEGLRSTLQWVERDYTTSIAFPCKIPKEHGDRLPALLAALDQQLAPIDRDDLTELIYELTALTREPTPHQISALAREFKDYPGPVAARTVRQLISESNGFLPAPKRIHEIAKADVEHRMAMITRGRVQAAIDQIKNTRPTFVPAIKSVPAVPKKIRELTDWTSLAVKELGVEIDE